jgi:uncharacterized membrane protein
MQGLGFLPERGFSSAARGVSGDGSVVVGSAGYSIDPLPSLGDTGAQAFRWTKADGMIALGPTDVVDNGYAFAASVDGSVVVGVMAPAQAFRWTAEDGRMVIKGTALATDVSADGKVVVGIANEAFRLTADGEVSLLGPDTRALGISADGSTIVGIAASTAAYWKAENGWETIGTLPGNDSAALSASADGSVIVGNSGGAFFWTRETGSVNLRGFLLSHGIADLQNWTLGDANDVSADGRTIVGLGRNADGKTEAWVATIPEPSSLALAALAVIFAAGIYARRAR